MRRLPSRARPGEPPRAPRAPRRIAPPRPPPNPGAPAAPLRAQLDAVNLRAERPAERGAANAAQAGFKGEGATP